jgi:lipoprotein-anchoring transpeptidase ErfK/SrfK
LICILTGKQGNTLIFHDHRHARPERATDELRLAARFAILGIAAALFSGCATLEKERERREALRKQAEERRLRAQGIIPVPGYEPARIHQDVLDTVNRSNSSIKISLGSQRAYLMAGGRVAVDTPVSTGKPSTPTPRGRFSVIAKELVHSSSTYGAFVDSQGRIVRGDVSTRKHRPPPGTRFAGAPMNYFLRLTRMGVGMHVGFLPGYPASHGCIRLPAETGPIFYEKSRIGTPVRIVR